jgi:signal peptidase I
MAENEPKIKSWQYVLSFAWETAKIIIISLAIIIPIRYFLFQPFFVRGASMEPNFENGEYLIIDEISYRFHEPERGDVIVFKYPKHPSQYYIKRIVALPEEVIRIEDGKITIFSKENPVGFILDEPYLSEENKFTPGNLEINLDENDYFVLGDNRQASSDSRIWGSVPRHYIIGQPRLRAWPFDRVGILD